MNMPYYAAAGKPIGTKHVGGGNRILDDLFGVELRLFPDGDWEQLAKLAGEVAFELTLQGETPYLIAIGGSSALGAYSFHLAGEEVSSTGEQFDFLVTPSSSGSTHAGLAYCFHNSKSKVIGISADPDPDDELAHDIAELCDLIAGITGINNKMSRSDIDLRMDYCGEAYGIPSVAGRKAIERFAKREGIILDPVYSGKAAAGLFDLIEAEEIGGKILFWHTGGSPTLFTTP
jgi:1-aminocyclopropane-1-carboxylate deaminase/D-cysteine desulfhydrase-like pyridoxal-dependent ACC family enzyme